MELTQKGFVEWLRSGPLDRIIGERAQPRKCPVAKYLSTIYDSVEFVGPCTIVVMEKKEFTPHWASNLICHVDRDHNCPAVTARYVLNILHESTDENYLVVVVQQGEARCHQPR